ncbi:hypothetical protein [Streptomyces cyaneofuscatus]|uniref:hypothetical protein n=1 Tax=Streptomyces cyaneofuscatus TaxID=66883 RepID=UPI00343EB266
MRHVPVFRWVLALGLALITWSGFLYATTPDHPELRQVQLTVLDEKPDGACTVTWTDPFRGGDRKGTYRCDAGRDPVLKAPRWDGADVGWDIGWVRAEGPGHGELYSMEDDGGAAAERMDRSDTAVVFGLLLTVVAIVGGNIRSLSRARGVRPGVLRRARRLQEAAELVAQDHRRAVEAVRTAWAPLHRELVDGELARIPVTRLKGVTEQRLRAGELEKAGVRTVRDVLDAGTWTLAQFFGMERDTAERTVGAARRTADAVGRDVARGLGRDVAGGTGRDLGLRRDTGGPEPRTTALLAALRVLVDAGPQARSAGLAGEELAARLEPLLVAAAPAAGFREMLRTGKRERDNVLEAVAELRQVLAEAEREGWTEQFAQASVDLLRGPDADADELSTWADFETRPSVYYGTLATVTGNDTSATDRSSGRARTGTGPVARLVTRARARARTGAGARAGTEAGAGTGAGAGGRRLIQALTKRGSGGR